LGRELEELYRRHSDRAPFTPDAASAGHRALRNAALTLLIARDTPADRRRLLEHYRRAGNMTDEAYALYLIAASRLPQRGEVLAGFYDRWQGDHLVIDTWFAAQAMAPDSRTLERVHELMRHPLFALTQPNKVRALIGNFTMGNPSQFNRVDGSGYRFLAEQVL